MRIVLLLLAIVLALPLPASCEPAPAATPTPAPAAIPTPAPPPEPDMPDGGKIFASDPFTVEAGHWSVQPGTVFSISSGYYDGNGRRISDARVEQLFYNLQITYGLSKEMDLSVTAGDSNLIDLHNATLDPEGPPGPLRGAGLTDLVLSTKWHFYSKNHLDMAHVFSLVIPTGSNEGPGTLGITQGYTTASYRFVASKSWGKLSMNGDFAVYGVLGHHSSGTTASLNSDLAFGYQCTKWLQPIVELNYVSTYGHSEAATQGLGVTVGATVKTGDVTFTLGAQKTVWGRNANDTLSTTFSVNLGF